MIMKKFIKNFVLMAVVLCIVAPAFAADKQVAKASDKPADNMQLLLEKLKADKKLLVAENMQLTEAESKVFWPVYEAYQKDLDAINNRIRAMIMSYAEAMKAKDMDDGKAKRLTSEMLSIQSDEVKLMQNYALKDGQSAAGDQGCPLFADREQDPRSYQVRTCFDGTAGTVKLNKMRHVSHGKVKAVCCTGAEIKFAGWLYRGS